MGTVEEQTRKNSNFPVRGIFEQSVSANQKAR